MHVNKCQMFKFKLFKFRHLYAQFAHFKLSSQLLYIQKII